MRSMLQLLGGVAVAGVVAAGSTALTGMGMTSSQTTQAIGGTVTQTVTGADLTSIVYHSVGADVTGRTIDKMTITFTGAIGKGFALVTKNGVGATDTGYSSGATIWSCDETLSAAGGPTITGPLVGNVVICEPVSGGAVAGTYVGLYSVTVTVS
jgi:hypothetical protein